ncbi:MAG: hypothetical protein Q7T80_14730 [Methanoregula sp.]|nr:hypothetical protein [Methanoregula sp.]
MLCTVIGIPLSVLTVAIFLVVRRVPSRLAQCLIPLVAGIVVAVIYTSMEIPAPGEPGLIWFLTGMFIHPLLILPPIIIMQKYLNRIPVMYAVFFTAFISMGFVLTLGAMQGDVRLEESRNVALELAVPAIKDLIAASVASGLILGLDRILSNPEKKNL